MGKIYQGILGPFSGKVGTVVGSIRKGQGYMRGLAASKKDARTESQLAQRAKFAITQKLLKGITPYLRVGYRGNTDTATPYNVATSKNVKLCIAGKYPSLGFDPSKLVLSEGSLEGVEIYAASIKNNVATFTWTDNSDEQSANMNDFAMPMVYNFSKCKAIYSLEKASRVDGNTTLDIPASWKNDKLSCYIAFAAVETNAVSDTIYIGDVKTDGSVAEGANGIILEDGSSEAKKDNASSGGSGSSGSGSTTTPTTPSGGSSSSGSSTDSGSTSSGSDNPKEFD